jgi:hypothetical protein
MEDQHHEKLLQVSCEPQGSSSTSVVCPRCSDTARDRTAQAESSSFPQRIFALYLFSVASAGCIETGASRRIDGEPGWFECSPRYSTNSSSSRRVSRRYSESSTVIALRLSRRFVCRQLRFQPSHEDHTPAASARGPDAGASKGMNRPCPSQRPNIEFSTNRCS